MKKPTKQQRNLYLQWLTWIKKLTKRYSYFYALNHQDRKDLEADVLLYVFAALPKYDESKAAFSTWVIWVVRSAVNKSLRHLYKFKRGHTTLPEAPEPIVFPISPLHLDLPKLKLTPSQREVLICLLNGYRAVEVARVLGRPHSSVSLDVQKLRKKVRRLWLS